MDSSVAPATVTAYERVWQVISSFLKQYNLGQNLPLSVSTVALFVSFLFAQSKAPRTISSNLSAISFLHKMHGFPDPTK